MGTIVIYILLFIISGLAMYLLFTLAGWITDFITHFFRKK